MSKIQFTPFADFMPQGILDDFNFTGINGQTSAPDPSSVTFALANGLNYTLTGTGFTYDAAGKLAGGTITGLSYFVIPTQVGLQISELNVSAAAFAGLARANDVAGMRALVFGGNDTVTFTGLGGPSAVHLYGGNDKVSPGANVTLYDGGDGLDVYVMGLTAAFTPSYTRVGNDLLIAGGLFGEKPATLTNFEVLQYRDKFYFNLSGTDATVARLYSAALARAPDIDGLAVQLDALHHGLTPLQLANNFVNSAEFIARYGASATLSNTQYATQLYANVLGRQPDPDGLAVQVHALDTGLARDQLLLNFADAAENKAKVLADWLLA